MCFRIVVADDHEVVRRGLRGLLESHPGCAITAEAGTGFEIVQKAARTAHRDCALTAAMAFAIPISPY